MMDTNLLEQLGLEKSEIKVYVTLLELGLSTTGLIVKRSGVPSSRIYDVLESLIDKGLVSYAIIKNTKHFKSANPERLYELIDEKRKILSEKENELRKLLPELKKKQQIAEAVEKKEQKIQMFEGIKGIKTALENVLTTLKKGDE